MPAKHKERLDAFFNSLASRGVPQSAIDAAKSAIPEDLIDPIAEGVLAQSDYSRNQNQLATERAAFERNRAEWQSWYDRNSATFQQSETERASLRAALAHLAQQYEIPQDEVQRYLQTGSFSNGSQTPPASRQPMQPSQPPPPADPRTAPVTAAQLVATMAERDEIFSRHFELTGKPLNTAAVIRYMEEQARLGTPVADFETAWRLTNNIATLEAAAVAKARDDERAAIRREVEEELAGRARVPNDPAPRFDLATPLKDIMRPAATVTPQLDANGQPLPPVERGGHTERTRLAARALIEMQRKRALGQPTGY